MVITFILLSWLPPTSFFYLDWTGSPAFTQLLLFLVFCFWNDFIFFSPSHSIYPPHSPSCYTQADISILIQLVPFRNNHNLELMEGRSSEKMISLLSQTYMSHSRRGIKVIHFVFSSSYRRGISGRSWVRKERGGRGWLREILSMSLVIHNITFTFFPIMFLFLWDIYFFFPYITFLCRTFFWGEGGKRSEKRQKTEEILS